MGLLDLTTVVTVQETKSINGWIYRISQSDKGCTVMRVPEEAQIWAHGIIKQVYQPDEKSFVPSCKSGLHIYMDLTTALNAIIAQGAV